MPAKEARINPASLFSRAVARDTKPGDLPGFFVGVGRALSDSKIFMAQFLVIGCEHVKVLG